MDNIKHIFFDLDHTLWDFEKNSKEALAEIFESMSLGEKIESFERFMKKYSQINKKYWDLYRQNKVTKEQLRLGRFEDTFRFFKLSDVTELAVKIANAYVTLSPTKTNLFEDTHEVLTKLNTKYQLHIITNGFVEVQHIKLSNSDLAKYFKVVVCSEETGFKKPHKAVFNFALEKAGAIASESFMIGDSRQADVQGGLRSGMGAIWFNPYKYKAAKSTMHIAELKELSTIFNV
jgi:putative hydrolase of the HAD superfamily